ncbi:GRF zinc finger domain-containing protein [Thozetella sp. PMI_491]|nr:GRF zinc finger domain-containing protein [Thozetella sp. PMI_491]
MDAFVTRKKRKSSPEVARAYETSEDNDEDDSTDLKLAILSSLHPNTDQESLLDVLLAHNGSVQDASASLTTPGPAKKASGVKGAQTSLRSFALGPPGRDPSVSPRKKARLLSKKGTTLHLFDPVDVSEHTPCTIIHNFLPPDLAHDLLVELVEESKTFDKIRFQMFDRVVASPHTSSFYVDGSLEKYNYIYNGSALTDVRSITPNLQRAMPLVEEAVNKEVQDRIRTRYRDGKKLKYQSPNRWSANAAFINCYNGPQESLGWHSDQLTYLGPRAIIGSLSLGVSREFRVRRIVPKDGVVEDEARMAAAIADAEPGDASGQIAIHLPHNSLLVMHAEMQEEWKHSIAPAQAIEPHPVAGNRRINVTYRDYRADFHPRYIPRCKCGNQGVLRVVQRKKDSRGRYFWMCHEGNIPGKENCSFFQWAEFDDDGNPPWPVDEKDRRAPVPSSNVESQPGKVDAMSASYSS